ncbi:MAG: ACR3 family arsenite efflux transporter [Actinomycetota bacterium]|nr:ACR3 family arsenite efflux transporter [Actinomycetota bacterium]
MSFVDRFLAVWIMLAMAAGIGLGRAVPGLNRHLNAIQVTSGTSLPIFIGLLVMMYPVLAKVRYGQVGAVTRDRRMLISSLILNWLVGPAVMFTLAWLMLPDQPTYRTGLIIVGLARCIAMVLIWNELACGDREAAAVLVALNSLFQILMFSILGYFYLQVLPRWLGLSTVGLHLSIGRIAQTVAIFLGVPLVAGFLTRAIAERARGREWYEEKVLPRLAPFALYGLLYTIVILFALQGHTITTHPGDVARIALPLLAYFAVMWFGSFYLGRGIGLGYERTATLAFTAAGNNFELAIAVAIGVFGVTSGQALAGVVGPLIEVPVLVALVYVALWARRRYYPPPAAPREGAPGSGEKPVVLFLCIHNSGRSLAAKVLLEHYARGRVEVRSAGSAPGHQLNPSVVAVLRERGLDTSEEHPKRLTDDDARAADVVVTMGCGDTCPYYPAKRYLDWQVTDPAGLPVDQVRPIVADIDGRVRSLLAELTGDAARGAAGPGSPGRRHRSRQ